MATPRSIGEWLRSVIAAPDRIVALLSIVVSLGVVAIGVVRGSPIALLIGVLIGVPGAVWYISKGTAPVGAGFRLSDDAHNIVSGLFFLAFALTLGSFALRETPYDRPEIFFVLIPILVGLTVIGTLGATRPWHSYLGLAQVLLIGLLISWTQIIMTPDVIGFDPWYHKALVEEILQVQTLPDNVLFAEYVNFPIFHLTVAAMRLMTGLPYHLSAMLSISLMLALVNILFVSLLAALICPARPSLRVLAPLAVVISPLQLYMLYWLIPNGFALVFVLPALYLLYRHPGGPPRRGLLLLAVLLGTLILAHTVTALFMAIALFVSWAAFTVHGRLVASAKTFPILIPAIFTTAVLAYWALASGPIDTFYSLIEKGFSRDSFSAYYGEAILKFRPAFPWESIVSSFTHYVFLFLPLLGMLFLVSRRGTRLTYNLALLGITPLAVVSLSYLLRITVIEDRWVYFAAVLNGIAIAIMLLILYGRSVERPERVRYGPLVAALLVVCSLSVLSEVNPNASIEYRPLAPTTEPRPALSVSEQLAVVSTSEVWDRVIQTDEYYYQTQRWTTSRVRPDTIQLFERNLSTMSNNLVLVREKTIIAPRFIYSYDFIPYYDLDAALLAAGFSRVYDIGSVQGYLVRRA